MGDISADSIDFASRKIRVVELYSLAKEPIKRGLEETVGLEYPAGEGVLMQKGTSGELSVEIDLPQSLAAPVEKGQTVGYVTLKGKEGILGKWPIVTQEKAEEITFLSSLEILYKSLIRL